MRSGAVAIAAAAARAAAARRCCVEVVPRGDVRPRPQSLPRRPVDARHLVGHRLGRDAAGLRQRLPRRARPRVSRGAFGRRRRHLVARPDEHAGRRRARRPARARHRRRRAAASASCRWSRPSAPSSCRSMPVVYGNKQSSYLIRGVAPRLRRDAHRDPAARAAGSSTTKTCGCSGASRSSAAKCSRKLFGEQPRRRPDDPHRRPCRSKSIGVMKEKVQLSNYNRPDKQCVFIPYTTWRARSGISPGRRRIVWQAVDRRRMEPKAEQQVRELLGKRHRLQPGRRARAAQLFGLGEDRGDHARHRRRAEAGARRSSAC